MRLRIVSLSFLTLLLAACGQRINVSKDCPCGFYTNDGHMMHWPDGTDIKYTFHKNFPEKLRPALVESAQSYNELLSKTHLSVDAKTAAAPDVANNQYSSVSGDGVNGIYWMSDPWPWAKSDPDSDAMTVVVFSKSGIAEADLFFRARSFEGEIRTPAEESAAAWDESGEPVIKIQQSSLNVRWIYVIGVHEFGHSIGRVHSHREDSIMFPSVGLDSLPKPFTDYDRDVLDTAYLLK